MVLVFQNGTAIHFQYDVKLVEHGKVLQKNLTWPRNHWNIKNLQKYFNAIFVVGYGKIYESID